MAEMDLRAQRVIAELTRNESLLDMLDTDAAMEMLDWGASVVKQILGSLAEGDDLALDAGLAPRWKALRQVMRSAGNWAAGKYADPESRLPLREKLLENFKTLYGEEQPLPSADAIDEVLGQVEDGSHTPHQLILKLRELFELRG